MAHADDRTARCCGAHRAFDRLRFGFAELPPAIGAPRVPVPAVRRDLDARHDDRKTVAPGSIGELVRDVVVVSHAEEVEASFGGRMQHLGRPRIAVRIKGVAVQVTTDPPMSRIRKWIGIGPARKARGLPRRPQPAVEPDLDLPVAAARPDLVGTEQHMPPSRADLPLSVWRRGPALVDRELHLVASAPAAKAGAALGGATLVEQPYVQGVAAARQRVRIDLIAVRVAQMVLPNTRRHLERHVGVPAFVILLKTAGQDAARRSVRRRRRLALESVVRQFSAAPVVPSKTRTPSCLARRYTRAPGSGRTSGAVRTLRSTSASCTLTITSLPSGSDTSTSAGCPSSPPAIARSIASGRRPTFTARAPSRRCGASMRQPPATTSASPSRVASRMFIGGLPMNCATNRFAGRW